MSDFSYEAMIIKTVICEEAAIVRGALTRPSVIYKPKFGKDGDMYFFLLGEDIQNGVAGFGKTPELAALDFDERFQND